LQTPSAIERAPRPVAVVDEPLVRRWSGLSAAVDD
jgi:hypothetical protein